MYDLDIIYYSGTKSIGLLTWRNGDLETQKFLFTFRVYVGGVEGVLKGTIFHKMTIYQHMTSTDENFLVTHFLKHQEPKQNIYALVGPLPIQATLFPCKGSPGSSFWDSPSPVIWRIIKYRV